MHLFIEGAGPDADEGISLVNTLQASLRLPGEVRGQTGVLGDVQGKKRRRSVNSLTVGGGGVNKLVNV